MTQISDQSEFMRLGGQQTNAPNWPQAIRYLAHIREEMAEIDEAMHAMDATKIVDGINDLMVVACGSLISLLGEVDAQRTWDAVTSANMSKVDGSFGPIKRRPDGQVGKPDGWIGPEPILAQIIKQSGLQQHMFSFDK